MPKKQIEEEGEMGDQSQEHVAYNPLYDIFYVGEEEGGA